MLQAESSHDLHRDRVGPQRVLSNGEKEIKNQAKLKFQGTARRSWFSALSLSLSQCVSIELDPLLRNEPRRASFRFLSFLLFRVSITADHHDGSMNPARPPAARDLFKLHHYFRSPWVCTSSFFFLFLFIFLVGCRSLLFLLLLLTNAE